MLTTIIKEKLKTVSNLIATIESRIDSFPPGKIWMSKSHDTCTYYSADDDGKKRYISKDNTQLISALMQKDYELHLLDEAKKQQKLLESFLLKYDPDCLTQTYEKLSEDRKAFVVPQVLSNEEYARRWQQVRYQGNPAPFPPGEFYTAKGERVRSKSEIIIAGRLRELGVPYRYEYPWSVNGHFVYPDFTALNIRTRETFGLEHLGMMGDPNYRASAFRKLEWYAANGVVVGKKLLITMEDTENPLSTVYLDKLIRTYLI